MTTACGRSRKIARLNLRVDFNQGLDARLIDDAAARLLGRLKWRVPLRLACDSQAMIEPVRKAVELLRWHNVTPSQYFCYCLVNEDVEEALERVRFLKGIYVYPFCQPLMNPEGSHPTQGQKYLCEWVNQRVTFRACTFADFWKASESDMAKKLCQKRKPNEQTENEKGGGRDGVEHEKLKEGFLNNRNKLTKNASV